MSLSPIYKSRLQINRYPGRGKAFQFGFGEKYMDRFRGTSIVFICQIWEMVITVEIYNHKPKA